MVRRIHTKIRTKVLHCGSTPRFPTYRCWRCPYGYPPLDFWRHQNTTNEPWITLSCRMGPAARATLVHWQWGSINKIISREPHLQPATHSVLAPSSKHTASKQPWHHPAISQWQTDIDGGGTQHPKPTNGPAIQQVIQQLKTLTCSTTSPRSTIWHVPTNPMIQESKKIQFSKSNSSKNSTTHHKTKLQICAMGNIQQQLQKRYSNSKDQNQKMIHISQQSSLGFNISNKITGKLNSHNKTSITHTFQWICS